MNKALPKIKETEAEIREMLKSETQVKRQNRLRAVYLITCKQAGSRGKVAEMLGFNRNSISKWFKLYETGGLGKMLEIHKPSGAKSKIPKEAIDEIVSILATEKGFRTYTEIHRLVIDKYKIKINYSNVHHLVRYKLEAKAKSPRPSNPKKKKTKSINSELKSETNSKK
jgi:transposase